MGWKMINNPLRLLQVSVLFVDQGREGTLLPRTPKVDQGDHLSFFIVVENQFLVKMKCDHDNMAVLTFRLSLTSLNRHWFKQLFIWLKNTGIINYDIFILDPCHCRAEAKESLQQALHYELPDVTVHAMKLLQNAVFLPGLGKLRLGSLLTCATGRQLQGWMRLFPMDRGIPLWEKSWERFHIFLKNLFNMFKNYNACTNFTDTETDTVLLSWVYSIPL